MNYEALAWAIDCEGSIQIKKRKKPLCYQAEIKIGMCDKKFPERMKEVFKCGNVYTREREINQRPIFTWVIQKQEDVERILKNCLPFFIVKGEKAEVVLAFLKFKNLNHTDKLSGKFKSYPPYIWKTYEDFYQKIRSLTNDKRFIAYE